MKFISLLAPCLGRNQTQVVVAKEPSKSPQQRRETEKTLATSSAVDVVKGDVVELETETTLELSSEESGLYRMDTDTTVSTEDLASFRVVNIGNPDRLRNLAFLMDQNLPYESSPNRKDLRAYYSHQEAKREEKQRKKSIRRRSGMSETGGYDRSSGDLSRFGSIDIYSGSWSGEEENLEAYLAYENEDEASFDMPSLEYITDEIDEASWECVSKKSNEEAGKRKTSRHKLRETFLNYDEDSEEEASSEPEDSSEVEAEAEAGYQFQRRSSILLVDYATDFMSTGVSNSGATSASAYNEYL